MGHDDAYKKEIQYPSLSIVCLAAVVLVSPQPSAVHCVGPWWPGAGGPSVSVKLGLVTGGQNR